MEKAKTICSSAVVESYCTEWGKDFLRNFNLKQLEEVQIIPDGSGFITARFYVKTAFGCFIQLDVKHAFCVGYGGEGPRGLHDIMIEAGYPEHQASKVFTISRYEHTIIVKEK